MKASSNKPAIKVHHPRLSSAELDVDGGGEHEQTNILSGLRLGGVWMDLFQKRIALEETVGRQREILQFTTEDRDTLQWERRFWVERFKANAASLSHTELSHLEAQQIIDIVKKEKIALDGRCLSLESQREWLERERAQLKKRIDDCGTTIQLSAIKVAELNATVKNQVDENKALQDIIYSKDEQIENLKKRVTGKDEELEVLKHSSATKDRQILTIVKERDRLRDENEVIKKRLARTKAPSEGSTPPFSRSVYKTAKSPADVASFSTPQSATRSIAVDIPSSHEHGFRLDELLQLSPRCGFDFKERSYLSIIHKLQQDLKEAQGKPRSEVVVNTKLLRSAGKSNPASTLSVSNPQHKAASGFGTPLSACRSSTPASMHGVARELFTDEQQPPACNSPPKSPTKMALRREKTVV